MMVLGGSRLDVKRFAVRARPTSDSISLVVTDLDGTLWDGLGVVHRRVAAALDELDTAGVHVLAATARRLPGALEMMRQAGVALPVVALDGCVGVDRLGVEFHRSVFPPDVALNVLAELTDRGLEPCVNVVCTDGTVLVGRNPASHPGHLEEIAALSRTVDLNTDLRDHDVMSFLICGCEEAAAISAARRIEEVAAVSVSVSRDLAYGEHALSVRPGTTDKWSGVVAYCRHMGLDADRVLAIGDGENDRPVLEAAAISCAPADASASILDLVDHVTGPTSTGGWADILELL
jgi:HAD superfamily hydrolase (TIGR01484 family)